MEDLCPNARACSTKSSISTPPQHRQMRSCLPEAFAQEPEARDAFVRNAGTFDERAFNRARIYGIADDLRWGLIGALLSAKSRRNTLEFYKFASWRFLRCSMAVREPRLGEASTIHERNLE